MAAPPRVNQAIVVYLFCDHPIMKGGKYNVIYLLSQMFNLSESQKMAG